jgi:sec-independent protein translocase protein TatA
MGIGGISAGQLILILLIVALLFGTKKLGSLGEDLGKAIRGFRKGMRDGIDTTEKKTPTELN